MALPRSYGPSGFGLDFSTPWVTKWILIINFSAFVVYFLAAQLQIEVLTGLFRALSLIPNWLVFGALWQPFTYLFLHDPYGFNHILFNMLGTWMFGRLVEQHLGSRRYIEFYLFCGVGAGLCDVALRFLAGANLSTPTIGNSGALFGIVLAFAMIAPRAPVMIFPFPIAIPAWVIAAVYGGIAFLSSFGGAAGRVSHIAHLGGMFFAFLYFRRRPNFFKIDWVGAYREWKLRRARRKFEVYMRKRDRDDGNGGGWVN